MNEIETIKKRIGNFETKNTLTKILMRWTQYQNRNNRVKNEGT